MEGCGQRRYVRLSKDVRSPKEDPRAYWQIVPKGDGGKRIIIHAGTFKGEYLYNKAAEEMGGYLRTWKGSDSPHGDQSAWWRISNVPILKSGEYSRNPSTVVVPGPLFGSVTELSNAMRNAKEWKVRKISRVIIASGTHYVPDGGLRLIGHEFAGLEIRGEGIGKTVLKGGGGGNGKGTIYIENTSGIVHLVNLTLANCR